MKNTLLLLVLCAVLPLYPQATDRMVSGQVTDVWETPIEDVNVLVKGTERGVQTDTEGRFSLNADTGEVLVFSAVGYGNVEMEILEIEERFKIILSPRTTKLKEVVVEETKRKTRQDLLVEYATNKNLIKTTMGILDKDRSSTALEIIDGDNLLPVGADFLASLQNFNLNMRVVRPPEAPYGEVNVYLRRISFQDVAGDSLRSSQPRAIFDVDGFVQETAPTYLAGSDIDRVAILERNAAVTRYGPRAIGGVIIINTKAQSEMDAMGYGKDYTAADVRNSMNNLFEGADYVPAIPEYMEAFGTIASEGAAMELLQTSKGDYLKDSYFLMDMAYYFRVRWKDEKEANNILKEVHEEFSQNIPALRGLAYRYAMLGKHDKALEIFLEVLEKDPLSAQSYCDVAQAYAERMNYKKVSKTYEDYKAIRGNDLPFDAYGADLFMTTDSYGYVKSNKERPSWEKISEGMGGEISHTRIALSWNNPDVKIGFQLEDPESSFKTWEVKSHDDETDRGYASTQFFLDENVSGEWLLNLLYYESETQTPTYLRITSYFNYGLPTQRSETRVLKLTQEYEGNGLVKINTSIGTLGK
ncbi:carboxypeptidase-like regulatory domain-containing protein [Flagellimonas olearia]|uniref:Uncharacterized protein n=1 Tax=Flagellimonas olearia TaxID=552546 RepID=A0A444VKQ2_9FLAO|nr:carboxypeptidase-like regulatory domain-containing protein [Allomuricauda olearia]RYC51341.1 hypothetical protein DN53_14165 [Allomuricauda olearia]